MIFHRRQLLQLAGAVLLAPAGTSLACSLPSGRSRLLALAYPARPVRLVVGSTAAAGADIVARLICQWLSERFGQEFIVESRTGEAINVPTRPAAADGYTLLMASAMNAADASPDNSPDPDFARGTVPIATIAGMPLVMAVSPSFPADEVPAFITYAKASPGKIKMASSGSGSPSHFAGELFETMADVDMAHVAHGDDVAAIADLLAGHAQVCFSAVPATIPHVRAGRLRALAVTGATRSRALPGIPAIAEFLPGYEATLWSSLHAPAKTPPEISGKLCREVNAALADPTFKARLEELGAALPAGLPSG